MREKRERQTTQLPRQAPKFSWKDVPYVGDPDADAENERTRKQREASERISAALDAAGVTYRGRGRFRDATLDNYLTPTQAHATALALCREAATRLRDGDGVLLVGEPGGGKTHLLIGMLRYAIERKMTVKYLTLSDFFAMMRGCIAKGESDLDCIANLARIDVLALDDIFSIAAAKSGTEQSYQYEKLWHLLDKRYLAGNATIASTNHDIEMFQELMDERTRRRLKATQIPVPKFIKPKG